MAPLALRPLRSRPFALVWSAALVSNVGSWMQTVALGTVVTLRTHDPLWTGLVAAAAFVPMGLLSPLGGLLADRLDRRRWLMLTTLAEAALAAGLAGLAAAGRTEPGLLAGLAFAGGAAAAVGFPAYQAMLPDLVPPDDLLGAVSLSSAQFNMGRVLGPALAGVVLVAGSATWAFAVNAASFGAVVVALAAVRLPARPGGRPTDGVRARLAAGVRTAAGDAGCRAAIGLISLVALVGSPFIALVPAVAIEALHRGAGGTAVLVTAQGAGAVAGAVALAPAAERLGRGRLVTGALFAFPAALVAYGFAPTLGLAAAALVVVGAAYIGVLSGLNTVVQLRAPAAARGRVLGLYMMALGTIYPLGAVVEGALSRAVGVGAVTVGAGLTLAAALGLVAVVRPGVFGALGVGRRAAAGPADVPEVPEAAWDGAGASP